MITKDQTSLQPRKNEHLNFEIEIRFFLEIEICFSLENDRPIDQDILIDLTKQIERPRICCKKTVLNVFPIEYNFVRNSSTYRKRMPKNSVEEG